MRLVLADIDDLAVTPADLSDLWFEGSPETVEVAVDGGGGRTVSPTKAATLDAKRGALSHDRFYELQGIAEPPCDATVTWDSGIAFLHVVSYHYCTLADVLDYGDEKRQSPKDLGRTEAEAFRARAVAEQVCDDLCGRPFRATRKVDDTTDGPLLVHQLEWPASRLLSGGWRLVGDGVARRPVGTCGGQMPTDVEYVSGRDARVPSDVRRAVAKLAASYLMVSKVPDRAVYESTDTGMTRYTLADAESTGIPDVDAIFARHSRKRWAVL